MTEQKPLKGIFKPVSKDDPAIDMEFLREATGGDRDFEHELFILFLDSTKTSINKFEQACKEKNEDEWYSMAHSIKGASSSIGAFYLSKISEYAQLHPKEEYEKKTKVLADLKVEFQRVADFINMEMAKK
jgi:HPt (histidine-containing phosphotransfer) domain-containing protein